MFSVRVLLLDLQHNGNQQQQHGANLPLPVAFTSAVQAASILSQSRQSMLLRCPQELCLAGRLSSGRPTSVLLQQYFPAHLEDHQWFRMKEVIFIDELVAPRQAPAARLRADWAVKQEHGTPC
jgi:hypothetical protein